MKQTIISLVVVIFALAAMAVSAQDAQFPNELKGYEFFQRGKLKELKLLVSTKADIAARVMGAGCENGCDYDADWKIGFSYVNGGWSRTDDSGLFKPKAEFVGKLAGITFHPRRPLLLTAENLFPDTFECVVSLTTRNRFKYPARSCTDDRRVNYNIAAENVSDGTEIVLQHQLMFISYMPTKKDDDAIFVLADK